MEGARPPTTHAVARPLSPAEITLLRAIHEADRDHGGLFGEELMDDEAEICGDLVERGLAEVVSEFGQAPDGEEDELDAGARYCFRITGRGVETLAEARETGPSAFE
jgi:hypothetical protein